MLLCRSFSCDFCRFGFLHPQDTGNTVLDIPHNRRVTELAKPLFDNLPGAFPRYVVELADSVERHSLLVSLKQHGCNLFIQQIHRILDAGIQIVRVRLFQAPASEHIFKQAERPLFYPSNSSFPFFI